jgi:hypothetical protein
MENTRIIIKGRLKALFDWLYKGLQQKIMSLDWHKWRFSLFKSLQLQFFISFISLPFLIGWGLPVSLLSPISTLIFGPFLSCFLLISSLIFFLELVYLPNAYLILLLEKITYFWIACLSLEQKAWLIAFAKPPMIILFLIPIIALAILHSKQIESLAKRTLILGLLLIGTCAALKLFPYHANTIEKIACNKGELTLINHDTKLILIDPGYLAARPSYESFIAFTLLPEIVKKTGSLTIDHVIVFKCNKRIFDALNYLATKITIKNIYIPYWNGKIPSFAWRSYVQLKKRMTALDGKIVSISHKKQLWINQKNSLSLSPIATKDISYYDATYYPLSVEGTINDQIIKISTKGSLHE